MPGTRSLIRHSSLIRHLNPFDSGRVTRITPLDFELLKREKGKRESLSLSLSLSLSVCLSARVSNGGWKERGALN